VAGGFGAGAGPPAALAEGITGAVAVGAVPRPSRSSSRAHLDRRQSLAEAQQSAAGQWQGLGAVIRRQWPTAAGPSPRARLASRPPAPRRPLPVTPGTRSNVATICAQMARRCVLGPWCLPEGSTRRSRSRINAHGIDRQRHVGREPRLDRSGEVVGHGTELGTGQRGPQPGPTREPPDVGHEVPPAHRRVVDPMRVEDPPEVVRVEPKPKPIGRQLDPPLPRHPDQSEVDLRERPRRDLAIVPRIVDGRDDRDAGANLVTGQRLDGNCLYRSNTVTELVGPPTTRPSLGQDRRWRRVGRCQCLSWKAAPARKEATDDLLRARAGVRRGTTIRTSGATCLVDAPTGLNRAAGREARAGPDCRQRHRGTPQDQVRPPSCRAASAPRYAARPAYPRRGLTPPPRVTAATGLSGNGEDPIVRPGCPRQGEPEGRALPRSAPRLQPA
jgi:hypothetical protein